MISVSIPDQTKNRRPSYQGHKGPFGRRRRWLREQVLQQPLYDVPFTLLVFRAVQYGAPRLRGSRTLVPQLSISAAGCCNEVPRGKLM